MDPQGSLYLADYRPTGGSAGNLLDRAPIDSSKILTWSFPRHCGGPISGIAIDRRGEIFAAGMSQKFICVLSPSGRHLRDVGHFLNPLSLAFDAHDDLYVSDVDALGKDADGHVVELSPQGKQLHVWNTRVISALAFGPHGNLYATEYFVDRVEEFSPAMKSLAHWGSPGFGPGQFNHPSAIVVDRSGRMYIADTDNNRIEILSPTGNVLHLWGVSYLPQN
jgi:streptogramin lyase